jgi:membrane protease YdiL (CAAX protease family)
VNLTAALVGLAVIWGGTGILISPAGRALDRDERIVTKCLGQLCLWLLFGTTIAIVLLWEKQPLASLWLRPLSWASVAWGLLLAVGGIVFIGPVREWVRRTAGLQGFAAGMEKVIALPAWFRIIAAITAGIVEETLFGGYSITRLTVLTGSLWLAAALSATAFAAVHIPSWGLGPALSILVGCLFTTAFFVWRQDLLAMIVAHASIDLWGFVVAPLYSTWWTDRRWA